CRLSRTVHFPALCPLLSLLFSLYAAHRHLHSFLHDALPISFTDTPCSFESNLNGPVPTGCSLIVAKGGSPLAIASLSFSIANGRSEEHTSELQSRFDLVCRLLLEKKKKPTTRCETTVTTTSTPSKAPTEMPAEAASTSKTRSAN